MVRFKRLKFISCQGFKLRLGNFSTNARILNQAKILSSWLYSVFHSAEVQKLWVLGKRQQAKGKREEK
ncbi:hypothetical protein [Microcystis aeruginosa]|uniref:Uncharacterized protein n=1 Tax=Microcystis aeruginosa NIES-3807 TaxID=2517785 RepID=A0AAD3G805_MICAE|nr:hypothetical protein [Microcystis aeruginosa]GCL57922.1 hypothetical protein NIES3807_10820 [Microcystis aeruginosa NIES-3807]